MYILQWARSAVADVEYTTDRIEIFQACWSASHTGSCSDMGNITSVDQGGVEGSQLSDKSRSGH